MVLLYTYGKSWNGSHHTIWFRFLKKSVPRNPFFIAGLSGVEILQQVFGPPPFSLLAIGTYIV